MVAANSPLLSRREKRVMERLFGGRSNITLRMNRKISVRADAVVCRLSQVDIQSRSCKLTFGATSANLTGRQAHELYATLAAALAEAGVPSGGALGSIFASLTHLVCTIDPVKIANKAGGGAECTFDAGAP
jgi:hypothetical protein